MCTWELCRRQIFLWTACGIYHITLLWSVVASVVDHPDKAVLRQRFCDHPHVVWLILQAGNCKIGGHYTHDVFSFVAWEVSSNALSGTFHPVSISDSRALWPVVNGLCVHGWPKVIDSTCGMLVRKFVVLGSCYRYFSRWMYKYSCSCT